MNIEISDDTIYGFDLDSTVICSKHRAKIVNGKLDLEDWIAHTREQILRDSLLPLGKFMIHLLNQNREVFICTARYMQKADFDLLEKLGLGGVKVIISRAKGDDREDAEYKRDRIGKAYREVLAKGGEILFFDDKESIRNELNSIGIKTFNPHIYNGKENGNLSYLH
jgi:hypothetical protein